jgi:hypothetical protein
MWRKLTIESKSSIEEYTKNRFEQLKNDFNSQNLENEKLNETEIFKRLELEDISKILPFLNQFSSHLSDFTVGGMFMWRDYFNIGYMIKNNSLFLKLDLKDKKNVFTFPIGGDLQENIKFLKEYCDLKKIPLIFSIISDRELKILKENCQIIDISNSDEWSDYFYSSHDLRELNGRKYSTQRNHINKFIRTYGNYQFIPISQDNINQAIEFLKEFYKKYDKTSQISIEDKAITLDFFDNFFKYNLFGGIFKVQNKIVAVSVGEIINDTLFVHIEKADRDYQGAYQMINNEFAKYYGKNVTYINREEDVGDEGLRKAKLMYNPIEILKKYIVEVKI